MKINFVKILMVMLFTYHNATFAEKYECKNYPKSDIDNVKNFSGFIKRPSPNILSIITKDKIISFPNEIPIGEDQDSYLTTLHYFSCDFVREINSVFILKADHGMFTGFLINIDTGNILPAGDTISFNKRHTIYFTTEQINGMDGGNWSLYDKDGKQLWGSFSTLIDEKSGEDSIYLEEAHLSDAGTLYAKGFCLGSNPNITINAYLVKIDNKYTWKFDKKCPQKT